MTTYREPFIPGCTEPIRHVEFLPNRKVLSYWGPIPLPLPPLMKGTLNFCETPSSIVSCPVCGKDSVPDLCINGGFVTYFHIPREGIEESYTLWNWKKGEEVDFHRTKNTEAPLCGFA